MLTLALAGMMAGMMAASGNQLSPLRLLLSVIRLCWSLSKNAVIVVIIVISAIVIAIVIADNYIFRCRHSGC